MTYTNKQTKIVIDTIFTELQDINNIVRKNNIEVNNRILLILLEEYANAFLNEKKKWYYEDNREKVLQNFFPDISSNECCQNVIETFSLDEDVLAVEEVFQIWRDKLDIISKTISNNPWGINKCVMIPKSNNCLIKIQEIQDYRILEWEYFRKSNNIDVKEPKLKVVKVKRV